MCSTQTSPESEVEEQSPCGRYLRFNKILGRGAFKDVYRGFDQAENIEIAWNQISLDDEKDLNSQEIRESLCYEAVMLKSLNHKNVMKCFTCWIDPTNRSMNMITELLDSGSIRQHIKKQGEIDVQTMKNWGRQILHGLKYLHGQNPRIVHRDLKCANIFLDINSDSIKIGDFGLATTMERDGPLRSLAGTPEFMAPEYYDEEYNQLVDIYAFGMCLMEMATCECPYSECAYPAQIFKKVMNDVKPVALSKVNDNEVRRVIEKCLLPASARPSASELLKDLFFFDDEILMEERISNEDSTFIVGGGQSRYDSGLSSCLDVVFSIEVDKSADAKDYDCYMDESILSDISALYDDDSGIGGVVETSVSCYKPCLVDDDDDVSIRSKVTFESSLGAFFSKDF